MIHPGGGRPIVLEGVGMNAFWTRRALLREGFTMAEAFDAMDSAGVVRVGEKDGQPLWALQQENVSREFYSVAGLLSALRE
jgi:hypothetical protein